MKNIINKIEQLNEQLHTAETELVVEFRKALQKVFNDHPDLEEISMYVNNHEFNDGDATSFYLGYEDMTVTINGEEVERRWDSKIKGYVKNEILDTLIELFANTQSVHERTFGGEYESMNLDRNTVLSKDFLKD
jgi:hypothetical protein